MSWFKRDKPPDEKLPIVEEKDRHVRTEGLWQKCESCRQITWKKDLEANWNVCPKCGRHSQTRRHSPACGCSSITASTPSSIPKCALPTPSGSSTRNPTATNSRRPSVPPDLPEAVVAVEGKLDGRLVQVCSMEPRFIGGSMAGVVGEKITRSVERAIRTATPLIVVSASGGARMQEGAVSLMQMAKISAALMRLDESRVPYISVLTDPTTGGVTASFAMLGDLNIAEPGALIGFAGPRVIEQTIRQKLPDGFQRSEFLLKHGMLDAVVPRLEMKRYVSRALKFFVA